MYDTKSKNSTLKSHSIKALEQAADLLTCLISFFVMFVKLCVNFSLYHRFLVVLF